MDPNDPPTASKLFFMFDQNEEMGLQVHELREILVYLGVASAKDERERRLLDEMAQQQFFLADSDHDGMISADEFQVRFAPHLPRGLLPHHHFAPPADLLLVDPPVLLPSLGHQRQAGDRPEEEIRARTMRQARASRSQESQPGGGERDAPPCAGAKSGASCPRAPGA